MIDIEYILEKEIMDMEQKLKNKVDFLNGKTLGKSEIETLHKKLIYELVEEKADVAAWMLSEGRYGVEINLKDFKFWGIYKTWEPKKQVMDNVLTALEEFMLV